MDSLKVYALISIALLSLPTAVLLYYGLAVYFSPTALSPTLLRSIALTLFSSTIASLLEFALFTPLAYLLAREESPFLESLSDVPASVPHPVVGIALLILDSPITPTGKFLQSLGLNFFDSFLGLVTALTVVSAPIYVRASQSLFSSMKADPEVFAMGMGGSRLRVLFSVVLPKSWRGITKALLLSTSRAMSEFGSVAILSYLVLQPPFSGTEPASVLIYQYYSYYGPQTAVTASALMVLVSLPIMVAVRIVGREKR